MVFAGAPGSYAVCPICYWEDDHVQLRFPTLEGGANRPSLLQAQKNFLVHDACEQEFKKYVRKPASADIKDPEWRMIDEAVDNFEEPIDDVEQFTPYPNDLTTLYYWRSNYWRKRL